MKVPQVAEGSGERNSQMTPPVVLFVTLEYHDAVVLVQQVHKSLATLSKVIRGTVLPSSDVVQLADSIINQQVCYYCH
jgi:dynein heavy chain 2